MTLGTGSSLRQSPDAAATLDDQSDVGSAGAPNVASTLGKDLMGASVRQCSMAAGQRQQLFYGATAAGGGRGRQRLLMSVLNSRRGTEPAMAELARGCCVAAWYTGQIWATSIRGEPGKRRRKHPCAQAADRWRTWLRCCTELRGLGIRRVGWGSTD
jgi:hypothetical protein